MSLLTIKNKIGIPSDWKIVPIGKVLVSSQYGTSNGNSDTGVPVVGMKNLQDGKVDFNDLPLVSVSVAEQESLLLHNGDILLNRTNSYDLVGKVGFVEKANEAVFASYLVRPKSGGSGECIMKSNIATSPTHHSGLRFQILEGSKGVMGEILKS